MPSKITNRALHGVLAAAMVAAAFGTVQAALIVSETFENYTGGTEPDGGQSINGATGDRVSLSFGWEDPGTWFGAHNGADTLFFQRVGNVDGVGGNQPPLQYQLFYGPTAAFGGPNPRASLMVSGSNRAIQVRGNVDGGGIHTANNTAARRQIATTIDSDEVLVGFMVRLENGFNISQAFGNFAYVWLGDGPTWSNAYPSMGVAKFGSNVRAFARNSSASSANQPSVAVQPVNNPGNFQVGTTYFLIASFQKLNDEGDPTPNYTRVSLWVNPAYDDGTGASPAQRPAPLVQDFLGASSNTEINYVGFAMDDIRSASSYVSFDNFRIATTWWELFPPGGEDPLFVDLEDFSAVNSGPGTPAVINWTTSAEVDNVGFNIYRDADGGRVKLNRSLIPAKGSEFEGATYSFVDLYVNPNADFNALYFLEDIDVYGKSTIHGPARLSTATPRTNVGGWTLFD